MSVLHGEPLYRQRIKDFIGDEDAGQRRGWQTIEPLHTVKQSGHLCRQPGALPFAQISAQFQQQILPGRSCLQGFEDVSGQRARPAADFEHHATAQLIKGIPHHSRQATPENAAQTGSSDKIARRAKLLHARRCNP